MSVKTPMETGSPGRSSLKFPVYPPAVIGRGDLYFLNNLPKAFVSSAAGSPAGGAFTLGDVGAELVVASMIPCGLPPGQSVAGIDPGVPLRTNARGWARAERLDRNFPCGSNSATRYAFSLPLARKFWSAMKTRQTAGDSG